MWVHVHIPDDLAYTSTYVICKYIYVSWKKKVAYELSNRAFIILMYLCKKKKIKLLQGSVFVYSMLGGLKKSNTSRMGLGADDLGVFPQQMGLVLDMDASFKDFTFQEGRHSNWYLV